MPCDLRIIHPPVRDLHLVKGGWITASAGLRARSLNEAYSEIAAMAGSDPGSGVTQLDTEGGCTFVLTERLGHGLHELVVNGRRDVWRGA